MDVVIMCNPRIHDKLRREIAIFAEDISDEGFTTHLSAWNGETYEEIKDYLCQFPELIAFIILGEIPIPWYEVEDWVGDPFILPIPGYYAFLDAWWRDLDGDGLFDGWHWGDEFITVAMLRPDLFSYGSEIVLLRRYLRKNHLFRTGQLTFPLRGLIYISIIDITGTSTFGIEHLYPDWDTVFCEDTHAGDLRERLFEGLETVCAEGHSGYWGTAFGDQYNCTSTFMDDEISTLQSEIGLAIVSGCHLMEVHRLDGVMHGYTFGSLGALFTINGYPVDSCFFMELSQGKSIAEALEDDPFDIYYGSLVTAGACMGDPTLKFGGFYQNSESKNISSEVKNAIIEGWETIPVDLDTLWDSKPSIVSLENNNAWCTWSSARGEHARSKCFAALYENEEWGTPEWVTHWVLYPVTWQVHHDISLSSLGNPTVVTETHAQSDIWGWDIAASLRDTAWEGTIISPSQLETRNYPTTATSPTGEQVVFWHSWTKPDADVYGVWKEGELWKTPICISGEDSDEQWVDALYSSNGELWIAFSERELCGDWDIIVLRIDPVTHQAIERITLANTAENERFPKLAGDQEGGIWCVWQKDEDEGCDIWISVKEDDIWSRPISVATEQGEDVHPAIAVNSQGDIGVVWMSDRRDTWDIWGRFFKDGEWGPEIAINVYPGADLDPDLTFISDDRVMVVWSTDRDGNLNIYSAIGEPPSAIDDEEEMAKVHSFPLLNIYPNPIKKEAIISYSLSMRSSIKLDIYNVIGQKVATLIDDYQESGDYRIYWKPLLTNGVYFYRLQIGDHFSSQGKLVILK